MEIKLYAKHAGDEADGWRVDVLLGSDRIATDLKLTDPFSKQEKRDAKWYIEQYAQISPYSVTRARSARAALEKYSTSILEQLKLGELIAEQREKSGPLEGTSISIQIFDDPQNSLSLDTVHQLHWELLEDSKVWALWGQWAQKVTVRRSIPPPKTTPWGQGRRRLKNWDQTQDSLSTINVLLVVARDLSLNSAVYTDVSPSLAYGILAKIKQDLRDQSRNVQLKIEIVRPGTFASFAQHLSRRERERGPGYFHIVHFDMHGVVSPKKKSASLSFSDPGSSGTIDIPAQDVADMLERFQIPFAVLNACESARANCGDDANIARIFTARGVKDVLAMSLKVSTSAADSCLRTFYSELLLEEASFHEAAAKARETMRSSQTRSARYGRHLDVVDWFVPVIYSSSADFRFQIPSTRSRDREMIAGEIPVPDADGEGLSLDLFGRDFDILRIEKLLLAEQVLYLHGPAGVGKSSLLRHCRLIWTETSFVDAVVYIDFSKADFKTLGDLVGEVLRQCLSCTTPVEKNKLWTMGPKKSHDEEANMGHITELLSLHRTVLMFDGLHTSHSPFGAHLGRNTQLSTSEINLFLRKLIPFTSPLTDHPSFLVLSDRREYVEWLSEGLNYPFTSPGNIFQLEGLQLADSVELSLRILRDTGENTTSWKRPELDQLDNISNTLLGIPDCLQKFLPNFKLSGMDLGKAKFRNTPPALWNELDSASKSLRDDIFASLMVLGLYWHEGPDIDTFAQLLVRHGVAPEESSAMSAIVFAEDRALIKVLYKERRVTWIHPGLTLYARNWAVVPEHSGRQEPSNVLSTLLERIGNLKVSRKHKAAELIRIFLDLRPEILLAMPEEKEFVTGILAEADSQFTFRLLTDALKGCNYTELIVKYRKTFKNVLSLINTCLIAEKAIGLGEWPMDFFTGSASNVRMVPCSAAEFSLYSRKFESLLEHFLQRVGGTAVPPEYQRFALMIINYLAATHNSEISSPTSRTGEFVQLALDIITASESKYGRIGDSPTMYLKGFIYRYKTLQELRDGNIEQTRKYWQMSSNNDEEYLVALEAEAKLRASYDSPLPEKLQGMFQSHAVPKAFIESRKNAFSQIINAAIQHIEQGHGHQISQGLLDAFDLGSFGLNNNYKALGEMGYTGLENDSRWWPENLTC